MNPSDQLQLTVEDKDRYEKRISEIDLNDIPMVLKEVPKKIESLVSHPNLLDYQVELVTDISKLLSILKDLPQLNEDLKKRIVLLWNIFWRNWMKSPIAHP
jgi:hypothetical protein